MTTTKKVNAYDVFNDYIIKSIEENKCLPWNSPYLKGKDKTQLAKNALSNKHYNGFNSLLLNALPFEHSIFATYKQISDKGLTIKKGSKSIPITFWKFLKHECLTSGKDKQIPMLKYYRVFNIFDHTDNTEEEVIKAFNITLPKTATPQPVSVNDLTEQQLNDSITLLLNNKGN